MMEGLTLHSSAMPIRSPSQIFLTRCQPRRSSHLKPKVFSCDRALKTTGSNVNCSLTPISLKSLSNLSSLLPSRVLFQRPASSATQGKSRDQRPVAAASTSENNKSNAPAAASLQGAKPLPLVISVAVGLIVRFLVPKPLEVSSQAWQLLAIFLSTITGLVLSPLPVGAWAFLGLTTSIITKTLTFTAAFGAFTNEVIWLIVISFFFARGFVKTGLGDRIATYFVKWLGKSTLGLSYGLTISEAFIAPAMPSTTARAGGVFLPIIKSLSLSSGSLPNDKSSKKLGAYLVQSQFQVTEPLVRVLCLVDGEGMPMGFIYEAMDRAKEAISHYYRGNTRKCEILWRIIDRRWTNQLHQPIHAFAYFLNPKFYFSDSFRADEEVMAGVIACIDKMTPDAELRDKVLDELEACGNSSALFLTAAAQNLLCLKLAEELGVVVSNPWVTWFKVASVPATVALLAVPYLLYKIYPPEIKDTPEAPAMAAKKLEAMGPVTKNEWVMVATMLLAVSLWVFGDMLGIASVVAAMLGLSILLLLGVLDWDDCLSEKSAWDTLAWFAVLVGMAGQLTNTGIVQWMSGCVAKSLATFSLSWPAAFAILQGSYFLIHYLFASQTGHVGALYSAFLAMHLAAGVPGVLAALALAYNTNLFGALTHYSSGQAAVYYGAGFIDLPDIFKYGFISAIFNVLIWSGVGIFWWKFLGLY